MRTREAKMRESSHPPASGLDRLGGQQPAVDFAQGDGERLLVRVRLDERPDVFEQALTELGVVRVDLPGALGRVDDQGVLGVGDLEQVIDCLLYTSPSPRTGR